MWAGVGGTALEDVGESSSFGCDPQNCAKCGIRKLSEGLHL
jgi:hypothetical protein